MAIEERTWRTGDVAVATGLTVRALHHYDQIGLVVPSERAATGHTIRRWHPDIRRLVELAAVEETTLVPIRSAVPIEAWPSSRVTLLGDAVHAMSPSRGSGANTALRDAALLAAELAAAARGDKDVVQAIGDYEREMTDAGWWRGHADHRPRAASCTVRSSQRTAGSSVRLGCQ
jgi:2-polyprenyl-6-methoxyphenol hydroxylase-like FAD-dependent oxidoreductase